MQKNNSRLLFLFFLLLFLVSGYWFVLDKNDKKPNLVENRSMFTFPTIQFQEVKTGVKRILQGKFEEANEVFFGQFINRTYQEGVRVAVSDRFPLRLPLLLTSKAVDRQYIRLAYALLPDAAIPADMTSGRYVMRDGSRLIKPPNIFDDAAKAVIDARIANYQELIDANPDIHFYVYYIETINRSSLNPLNEYFPHPDSGQAFQYFLEHAPEGLTIRSLPISSLDNFAQDFYTSDHHWNTTGMLKGYEAIYKELAINYASIPSFLGPEKIVTFPQVRFTGSLARAALYPLSDEFDVPYFDLPPYKASAGDVTSGLTRAADYFAGHPPTDPYLNHYALVYGIDRGLVKYVFDNGSQRNLLIVGNSFANPLEPLLGNYYHNTYSYDPRHLKNFSLSKFLINKPVQDVIFIGDAVVIYSDPQFALAK